MTDEFWDGIAIGQRITATEVDKKLDTLMPNMNPAVTKLIIDDLKKYLIAAMNITTEQAIELYKKEENT